MVFKWQYFIRFLTAFHLIFAKRLENMLYFNKVIRKQRKFLNGQQKVNRMQVDLTKKKKC